MKREFLFLLCLAVGVSSSSAQPGAAEENPAMAFRSRATALRFSRDGRRLISAGAIINKKGEPVDKRLRVWDVRSGREIHRLPAQPILAWSAVTWEPKVGRTLLLPDFKTMLTTWGAWEVKPVAIHSFHFHPYIDVSNGLITSLALSPDEKILAIGVTRAVEFRDARTYRLLHTYQHGGQGTMVQFGPDSRTLACSWVYSGSKPQTLDVATARQIPHPYWFYRVRDADAFAFSHDGRHLAKAKGQIIEIWGTPTPKGIDRKLGTLSTSLLSVNTLQFSPDGSTLAVGGISRAMRPVEFFRLKPFVSVPEFVEKSKRREKAAQEAAPSEAGNAPR